MEVWQKEALIRHRLAILDDLHVDYVLDYLLARQVLFEEHKENIFTQHGRRNRARYLLDLLPTLGPTAYEEFIASLKEPYLWLAEILSGENSKTTTTSVASTSQCDNPNSAQNPHQTHLNQGDINQLLLSLASVSSTCGKSLCAIGDAVMTIVQSMKNSAPNQLPNSHVSRQNSINLVKNEQQIVEASRQITMDRLRGGGDTSESETIMLKTEKMEVPPSSLSIPCETYEVGITMSSKDADVNPEKIEAIETVEKIIDIAYAYGDTIDGVMTNKVTREVVSSDVMPDLMINNLDNVNCIRENVEQFGTSHAKDELCNDSPDSGITGDGVLVQLEREMSSVVIVEQNGISDFGDDFENPEVVKVDVTSEADKTLISPFGGSQLLMNKDSNRVLSPVLNEMLTLQRSLSDMTVALRTIVQISEKTLKIASSVQN